MKKTIVGLIALLIIALGLWSDESKKLDRSFNGIKWVELNLTSSDCQIRAVAGDSARVFLEYSYAADEYSPKIEAQGDRLVIGEEFSHRLFGSGSGNALWRLELPKNVQIEFRSASGDLKVDGIGGKLTARAASGDIVLENLGGECSISTASGDIELKNITAALKIRAASGDVHGRGIRDGRIELSLASGDVDLADSQGAFDVKTASGDLTIKNIEISGASSFKSASGDVHVLLGKALAFDLKLAAASGDVRLDFDGQPMQGYFELVTSKDHGEIVSSVAFDKEEEFMEHGHVFVKKSFTRKSGTPRIVLETASGTIELEGK